jgi:DNA-binding transcriptional regulator YiaG
VGNATYEGPIFRFCQAGRSSGGHQVDVSFTVENVDAKALKRHRETLGYSQPQLAKALGVAEMTVSRWERGIHRIPEAIDVAVEHLEPKPGGEQLKSKKDRRAPRPGAMTKGQVKWIRRRLKLTQRALARRLGVERVVLAKWEAGSVPVPGLATKLLLCLFREHQRQGAREAGKAKARGKG